MRTIYAEEDWYRSRPEPEESWYGILEQRDPPAGPNSRAALTFALVTADGEIAVYAANAETLLLPFANRQVIVIGKLVDLTAEGFGKELWIAAIGTDDSSK